MGIDDAPTWDRHEQIEQMLLGAMMDKPAHVPIALELLGKGTDVFFRTHHQLIYVAILSAWEKHGDNMDAVMVAEELKTLANLNEIGGATYLYTLLESNFSTPGDEQFEFHASILMEKAHRRRFASAGKMLINAAQNEELSIDEILGKVDGVLSDGFLQEGQRKMWHEAHEVSQEVRRSIEARLAGDEPLILTGIPGLDELTGGITPGEIWVLGGRPGMGKTTMALSIAKDVAKQGCPVLFFSYETNKESLWKRLVVSEGKHLTYPKLAYWKTWTEAGEDRTAAWWQEYAEVAHTIPQDTLFFNDVRPNIDEIGIHIQAFLRAYPGSRLIIVDYLQVVTPPRQLAHSEDFAKTTYIVRKLAELASRFDVCMIVCSQLSRAIERRSDPTPLLGDLRSTGEIEQVAHLVAFLHREIEHSPEVQFSIKKQRNGRLGTIQLRFLGERFRFEPV